MCRLLSVDAMHITHTRSPAKKQRTSCTVGGVIPWDVDTIQCIMSLSFETGQLVERLRILGRSEPDKDGKYSWWYIATEDMATMETDDGEIDCPEWRVNCIYLGDKARDEMLEHLRLNTATPAPIEEWEEEEHPTHSAYTMHYDRP